MTNLSSDCNRLYKLPPGGLKERQLPLAGYTLFEGGSTTYTVYKGALVFCDANDTDGYFRPVDSAVAVTTADVFGGIAMEQIAITSSDAANGSRKVTVAVNGEWAFAIGTIAITDIGAPIYASDDTTVTTSSNDTLAIGILTNVDSTYAWVDITDYAGLPSASTT